MEQEYISVSKAAHMLGISRRDLQKLIHDGVLISMDGKVNLEELRLRYPQLSMTDGSMNERVKMIQSSAFGRRVRQTITPETDEIEKQLKRRTVDLSIAKARAKKYQEILHEMSSYLGQIQLEASEEQKHMILEINRWLSQKMCD